MFQITGTVVNVFHAPKGQTAEGKEFGGQSKVQILGGIPLPNGETRMDMVTLTTDAPDHFQSLLGAPVSVPVGFFVQKGTLTFFIPKGAQIAKERLSA
jgi:hypothetical protein